MLFDIQPSLGPRRKRIGTNHRSGRSSLVRPDGERNSAIERLRYAQSIAKVSLRRYVYAET